MTDPQGTYKLLVVVGTRPEAIKLAPVVLAARNLPDVVCHLCLTAQHRDLLDGVLQAFQLTADSDLNLMAPGQSLASLTAGALTGLDAIYEQVRPELVLVQGDTTTVLAATLAAFYRRIAIGHVEAGLRTGNMNEPWPEEANRVLTARLAALHFAPTEQAKNNLLRESVSPDAIEVTGNTGIDALFQMREQVLRAPSQRTADWRQGFDRFVLVTAHRRENFGAPFESLCHAIADLALLFPSVLFVYPVHPNPNIRQPAERILANANDERLSAGNVRLIAPLDYPDFVRAMNDCTLILTDSGGVQEEAPSLGKPVLVLRDVTERPEAVEAGTVRIVGTDRVRIVSETARLLTDGDAYQSMSRAHNPYGDGRASRRILARCLRFLADRT